MILDFFDNPEEAGRGLNLVPSNDDRIGYDFFLPAILIKKYRRISDKLIIMPRYKATLGNIQNVRTVTSAPFPGSKGLSCGLASAISAMPRLKSLAIS